ncbi:PIN domain-containing protein [Limnohabitans sp. T6-5]|uniref:type II toxin-antitoxin system VapC family toxin n=1 Tax=Limnohabitans sp. T6-5 TaxID=1100724 RepID=UPI001305010B|nr:PIN domain-containing protein [Limnohabitans sp. T6-5]
MSQRSLVWCGLPEGSTVLVDTAPWIYLLEDHPEFAPRFAGLFEAAESGQLQLALSTVTLAEVLTGPFKAGQTALARRYETALNQYQVVPMTPSVACLAAQLRVQYRLKLPDAVQLASALDIGAAALVTHERDYSAVQGLPILLGGDRRSEVEAESCFVGRWLQLRHDVKELNASPIHT